MTACEQCCNAYRNVGSIPWPKRADSEFGMSASLDFPSIWMEPALDQTAYPRLKTGRLRNQFGMCDCSSDPQPPIGDSFPTMLR